MSRTINIFFLAFIFALIATGCADKKSNVNNGNASLSSAPSIVATIFPAYDWIREIVGDNIENVKLTMLLDSGADLHSYQPSADDIVAILNCDMLVYVGGESDEWIADVISGSANKNTAIVKLLDVLGDSVKREEIIEGMESEEKNHGDEESEYDEHVWLSLKNARIICQYIADRLCEIDQDNAKLYSANVAEYIQRLDELDARYDETVSNARKNALIFADRFPFRYLTLDYGLNYYAAFPGCSAETEASFETIAFLAKKLDELDLSAIITLEKPNSRIAQTVASAAKNQNVRQISMDSMQSVTAIDAANGASYISIMEKNLEALTKALN